MLLIAQQGPGGGGAACLAMGVEFADTFAMLRRTHARLELDYDLAAVAISRLDSVERLTTAAARME